MYNLILYFWDMIRGRSAEARRNLERRLNNIRQ